MNEDKIISRVRKLMALANDERASEGERDNALRMAHATLAKYNLSMAQVSEGGAQEARVFQAFRGKSQPWTRSTANAVAGLFFCKYFYKNQGSYCEHNFIGRESNAITAKEIAEFVIKSILSEANRLSKYEANPNVWWTQFCKGAANQVWHRCAQLRKDAERESAAAPTATGTGTSIVLASLYKTEMQSNEDFLAEQGLRLRSAASRERYTGAEGYAAGKSFGAKVSLSRQVGATSNTARLR